MLKALTIIFSIISMLKNVGDRRHLRLTTVVVLSNLSTMPLNGIALAALSYRL